MSKKHDQYKNTLKTETIILKLDVVISKPVGQTSFVLYICVVLSFFSFIYKTHYFSQ